MDRCYADTETTSLRNPFLFAGRRIWETAIIRVDEFTGRVKNATWLQHIDVDLSDADPQSLKLGRFHERFSPQEGGRPVFGTLPDGATIQQHGVSQAEAARIIEELTRGAVIAGSNPAFDMLNFHQLLAAEFLPAEGWWHHPRDIPNLANGWLLGRQQLRGTPEPDKLKTGEAADFADWSGSSYPTSVLSEGSGVPIPVDRHSAWADALWCYQWDAKISGWDLALPAAA